MSSRKKPFVFLISILLILLLSTSAYAATINKINWGSHLIILLGGLAFFLYGMELMSEGMKKVAGDKMRSILTKLTKNKYRGMFLGIIITMIIQSGSATSVMLVSFVQAGLLEFSKTIGVLIGAGIGMTLTAQLIAFKLSDYALLFFAVGILIRLTSKKETYKNLSEVLIGFGILFYGLKLMGDSMRPLRDAPEIINFLVKLGNPWLGLTIGIILTAIIQSSTAFIGILIVLGLEGLIPLDASIPMIFGANIGTCITAGIASIGASRDAKRVALANVLHRIFGVTIFMFFIPEISGVIYKLGTYFHSDMARMIANVHTLFNVSLALIFMPLTNVFALLITKILPEKPEAVKPLSLKSSVLDDSKILSPALSIGLARTEISKMAETLEIMLRAVAVPFVTNKPKRDKYYPEYSLIEGIDAREDLIDSYEEKIVDYLVKTAQSGASQEQTHVLYSMISIVKDMESIGDIVHRNVLKLAGKKRGIKCDFSKEGKEELAIYHQKVCKQIRLLKEAFMEADVIKAEKIMSKERKYLDLEHQYRARHLNRLVLQKKESVATHEIHMELMNYMAQIIVYSSNIAKTFLQTCNLDKKLLI